MGSYYYDSFGNIVEETGDAENNFTYAGYVLDREVNLYYLNARYYDARIARFMTEDTFRGDPGDALSLNLYTYCSNNPLIYYDPTGHFKVALKYQIPKSHPDYNYVQKHGKLPNKGTSLNDLVTASGGTLTTHKTKNDNKSPLTSLTIQIKNSIVELYNMGDEFYYGNYYGRSVSAARSKDGILRPVDGVLEFLKDSNKIKSDYMEETGFEDLMADRDVSAYIDETFSEATLTYLREEMFERGGKLDLSLVAGENTSESYAIVGAVRKLTTIHGQPIVDEVLLSRLDAIAVANNYQRPLSSSGVMQSYLIDQQMFFHISNLTHYTQNAVNSSEDYDWKAYQENNLYVTHLMADAILDAEHYLFFYLLGVAQQQKEAEYVSGNQNAGETTRVGRWMSQTEYDKMIETGKVQMSPSGNTAYVANPADPNAFKAAPNGSVYVEFDIPTSSIYPAGNSKWGQVPGPDSFMDRLGQKKGLPAIEGMPKATNIQIVGSK